MKRDLPEPADRTKALREQLVLAQVRLMELEDERDAALARIAGVEKLLRQAQALADTAESERSRAQAETAAHASALELAQTELAATKAQLEQTLAVLHDTEAALGQSRRACDEHRRTGRHAEEALARLHASRSWRWTAWLRQLEKLFGAR
jgi:chromosome segregation ATPase